MRRMLVARARRRAPSTSELRVTHSLCALKAVTIAAAISVPFGANTPAHGAEGLFSLTTSDLTGPTSVTAGQGIWRSAAIRNTSSDLRLTIGLQGAGDHADWVQPAVARVELAPGQQQIVRFSVIPSEGSSGSFDVALRASLVEARRAAIIGETPIVTAEAREVVFSIEVGSPSSIGGATDDTTATTAAASPRSEAGALAGDASESLTGGAVIDVWRIVIGLLALAVLLGLIRRLGTRRRAPAPVVAGSPVVTRRLPAIGRVRHDRLREIKAEQRALEAMREDNGRVTADRFEYDFGRARARAEAKLARADDARRSATARIEDPGAVARDLERIAEEHRRDRVHARTDAARERLERREPSGGWRGSSDTLMHAEVLAVEAAADAEERHVPPPRRAAVKAPATPRANDAAALDIAQINRALESARARDGFDERPANLKSR